jgi:hypothetical protein
MTREQPVENLEVALHVSTVAHLGKLAFRSTGQIVWDAENEQVLDCPEANALLSVPYRVPWELPYCRRTTV